MRGKIEEQGQWGFLLKVGVPYFRVLFVRILLFSGDLCWGPVDF